MPATRVISSSKRIKTWGIIVGARSSRGGLSSGQLNPPSVDDALEQHRLALELAPYGLSLSPLDCEALDLMIGFDFTYRGNQNQLIAEALGVCPAFERLAGMTGATFVSNEPALTLRAGRRVSHAVPGEYRNSH